MVSVLVILIASSLIINACAIPLNVIETSIIRVDQNDSSRTDILEIKSDQPINNTQFLIVTNESRLRQDGDGDGGLSNVAEIVTGALGGGLGNIFQGSSSFIGNSAVQEEVNFVFGNISPVVDTLLKFSWDGLKQYFGIGVTTLKPILVAPVQPQPPNYQANNKILDAKANTSIGQDFQNAQNLGVPTQKQPIIYAPVILEPVPTPTSEDNDNDNESDIVQIK